MPAPSTPVIFDRKRLRAKRDLLSKNYHRFSFLKQNISEHLLDRLADTPRDFSLALDLGCHDGTLATHLAQSPRLGKIIAADLSPHMAGRAQTQGFASLAMSDEALAFADHSFELITSALSLHWANDLPGSLVQIRRVLKPDGLFLGALFGAGTLTELRTSFLMAESELTGGAAQRISPLPGLRDMADLMQRTGYALPVVDIDHMTVRYDSVFDLLGDLKGMGERACFAEPSIQGLSRRIISRMEELYHQQFSDPDGRIRASFEIIWLSGWAPGPGQPKPLKPGSAKASLADAVQATGRNRS